MRDGIQMSLITTSCQYILLIWQGRICVGLPVMGLGLYLATLQNEKMKRRRQGEYELGLSIMLPVFDSSGNRCPISVFLQTANCVALN